MTAYPTISPLDVWGQQLKDWWDEQVAALGGFTVAATVVDTGANPALDGITSMLEVLPTSDVVTGLLLRRFSDTAGGLGGNDYGEGQFILALKNGTDDAVDLVMFRVEADGSLGTGGNAHIATGLNQTGAGATSFGKMAWFNPYVDITGAMIDLDLSALSAPITGDVLAVHNESGVLRLNLSNTYALNFLSDDGATLLGQVNAKTTPADLVRAAFIAGAATVTPLFLKGAAAQSADIVKVLTSADVLRLNFSNTYAMNWLDDTGATVLAHVAAATTPADTYRAYFLAGSAATNVLLLKGAASQTGDLLQLWDSANATLGRFNKDGYFITKKTAAPADAALNANEMAFWFDATNGAGKAMFKGKTANGTVVSGSVALA